MTPNFCVILVFSLALWKSVVTLALTRNTICGRVFATLQGDGVSEASNAIHRKWTGNTFGEL
jgi:hypothetical protein